MSQRNIETSEYYTKYSLYFIILTFLLFARLFILDKNRDCLEKFAFLENWMEQLRLRIPVRHSELYENHLLDITD